VITNDAAAEDGVVHRLANPCNYAGNPSWPRHVRRRTCTWTASPTRQKTPTTTANVNRPGQRPYARSRCGRSLLRANFINRDDPRPVMPSASSTSMLKAARAKECDIQGERGTDPADRKVTRKSCHSRAFWGFPPAVDATATNDLVEDSARRCRGVRPWCSRRTSAGCSLPVGGCAEARCAPRICSGDVSLFPSCACPTREKHP